LNKKAKKKMRKNLSRAKRQCRRRLGPRRGALVTRSMKKNQNNSYHRLVSVDGGQADQPTVTVIVVD
jgi:hypothetical protein